VKKCRFCRRSGGEYALTVQLLDGSWRRGLDAVCERCREVLREAGDEGAGVTATGQRWFLGHCHGTHASAQFG
jgi:hypothetical protein